MRIALVLLALAPLTAGQDTLRRIRIEADDPTGLAARFELEGRDVLEGSIAERSLELVVSPREFVEFERRGFAPDVVEIGRPLAAKLAADGVPGGYPDLAAINASMAALAAGFPGLAQVVDLTATYGMPPTFEGRSLLAMKISDNVAQDEDEPALLVVSNHHAREIVTPVIALTLIERWLMLYGTDPVITALIDDNEVWIAPVWNPDGYMHVFQVDNLWRKNRRNLGGDNFGVDQNRNYPQGWKAACSGSSNPSSSTYKGPSPASEAETMTMIAFAQDRQFAKVIDFHSSGREVLWAYSCSPHPFESFLRSEAIALSIASGYGGAERSPSAEGEHYEWEFAQTGSHAFLIEAHNQFQPSYASALAEANQVRLGVEWMAARPIPIAGHVTDACTGAPLSARVELVGISFTQGETNHSGGLHGRYHVFAPAGAYTLEFSLAGFDTQQQVVTITEGGSVQLDVALEATGIVTVTGPAQPGTLLTIDFDMLADPFQLYFAAAGVSGTTPGIPIGGCTLPLNPDFVTGLSSTGQPPFAGFSGALDGNGHASGSILLPPTPLIVGLGFDLAFLTVDAVTSAFLHTSDATNVVVQP